jgi:hypothetical protein
MTPVEWLQHGSEGVVVVGALLAVLRKTATQIARLETAIDKVGNIDRISLALEAHIRQPADEAHGNTQPTTNAIRPPQPSRPGVA